MIWKTGVDPRGSWLEPVSLDRYTASAFPLPAGDLDGDGTADVIVRKRPVDRSLVNPRVPTSLVELISGRTGARIWSASPLLAGGGTGGSSFDDWVEPHVVERGGRPDVIAWSGDSSGIRLARISGRDGRMIWDVAMADVKGLSSWVGNPPRVIEDLDGDGALEAVLILPRPAATGEAQETLLAVSLRDGRQLWSQSLRCQDDRRCLGDLCAGDLDGDGLNEVVVLERFQDESTKEISVRVLEPRDGGTRWAWKTRGTRPLLVGSQFMALADFDGTGKRNVAVIIPVETLGPGPQLIVVLDEKGKERVRRELNLGFDSNLDAVDLNGDGRDELVITGRLEEGNQICVLDRDLKDIWNYRAHALTFQHSTLRRVDFAPQLWRDRGLERIIPAAGERAGKVVVGPALAIDGSNGKALWRGQASLRSALAPVSLEPAFEPLLLDRGDETGRPLLIAMGMGGTVCRTALPTNAEGVIAAPQGNLVVAGGELDDPRWTRLLPWREWLDGLIGPKVIGLCVGLALMNVFVPILILVLVAGRRRAFRVSALLALPVVAVLPLMAYLAVSPWLPVNESALLASEGRVYLAGTLAGVPIVYFLVVMVGNLVRRRWRRVLALLGLTVAATGVVAAVWVMLDRKGMATGLEHYGSEGWWLVILPGVHLAAVLWGVGWVVLRVCGLVRRRAAGGVVG